TSASAAAKKANTAEGGLPTTAAPRSSPPARAALAGFFSSPQKREKTAASDQNTTPTSFLASVAFPRIVGSVRIDSTATSAKNLPVPRGSGPRRENSAKPASAIPR